MDIFQVAEEEGFEIPGGYSLVVGLNLTNIAPWIILNKEAFEVMLDGISRRYPDQMVIPFARRQDNDDVACFATVRSPNAPSEIIIIHDFASPGWEVSAKMATFWDWFRLAVEEMIESHTTDSK